MSEKQGRSNIVYWIAKNYNIWNSDYKEHAEFFDYIDLHMKKLIKIVDFYEYNPNCYAFDFEIDVYGYNVKITKGFHDDFGDVHVLDSSENVQIYLKHKVEITDFLEDYWVHKPNFEKIRFPIKFDRLCEVFGEPIYLTKEYSDGHDHFALFSHR